MSDRLSQLLELLKEMPGDTFLKYGIALEYVSRNEGDKALSYFTDIHVNEPGYLPLYYQLGKLYEQTGTTDKAAETYMQGIEVARKQKDMHTLSELQSALDEIS